MSLSAMVDAAKNGKVTDFENAFNAVMAVKTANAINDLRAEIGASVPIEGEVSVGAKDGDKPS